MVVRPLLGALAQLLVRLHLAGFFWGDCSLSSTLFRQDGGALSADLVDAEPGELHPTLTDGQRRHDPLVSCRWLAETYEPTLARRRQPARAYDHAVTTDVDSLLDDLDRSLERGPSYADLFRRWEEQQWSVTAIDLSRDREGWLGLGEERQRYLRWVLTQFFQGEEAVTVSLAPFVDAAPIPEQQVFLTTQLVDEARHAMLFQRLFDEVIGLGTPTLRASLEAIRPDVTPGFGLLFFDLLAAATERVRNERTPAALVHGVTVYHLLVEGTVALAGQRHVLDWLRREDVLPGFREGFTHVTRDESRHVAFGVQLLRDAIAADDAAEAIVRETVLGAIPAVLATLEPPGGDGAYYEAFGFTRESVASWALDSLRRKLRAVGVAIDGLTD